MESVLKDVFMEGLMILLLLLKGLMDKNLFMAGATERAIATTTATNGAAKPSSGETTRPLNKIKKILHNNSNNNTITQ